MESALTLCRVKTVSPSPPVGLGLGLWLGCVIVVLHQWVAGVYPLGRVGASVRGPSSPAGVSVGTVTVATLLPLTAAGAGAVHTDRGRGWCSAH